MSNTINKIGNFKLINTLSFAIPIAVALLLGIRYKVDLGHWTTYLPMLNAIINSLTALLLVLGLIAVKGKNIQLHRASMLGAFFLGSLFLVSYVLYHFSNESTSFGGEGIVKSIYYTLLISHIILAAVVVRFVLMAVYYAINNDIVNHKKTVRWAFPIWLYVSVTGVIVYLMISPYYAH